MNLDKLKSLLAASKPRGDDYYGVKNLEADRKFKACLPELIRVVEAANSLGDAELSFDHRLNKIVRALDKLEKRLETV